MTNSVRQLAAIALLALLTGSVGAASAQNRERPSFSDIDADDDGKLTMEEFSGIGSRRGTPEEMFERLDTNGDGYVTEAEFQARQSGGRRGQ